MHIHYSIHSDILRILCTWIKDGYLDIYKAQRDAMEIVDSTNNKAKQNTDYVWVAYVKMGLFGKSTLHP